MSFTVTVLGSSGSYASEDNPCTGYLLRSDEATVLLDCGPGTLGPLQREISLAELDAIVVTHCHPDHWLELPVLRNVFSYFEVVHHLPVFGTAETKAMFDAFFSGDVQRAMEINRALMPSYAFETGDDAPNPIPTKAMLRTLGVPVGQCRLPLGESPAGLEDEARAVHARLVSARG